MQTYNEYKDQFEWSLHKLKYSYITQKGFKLAALASNIYNNTYCSHDQLCLYRCFYLHSVPVTSVSHRLLLCGRRCKTQPSFCQLSLFIIAPATGSPYAFSFGTYGSKCYTGAYSVKSLTQGSTAQCTNACVIGIFVPPKGRHYSIFKPCVSKAKPVHSQVYA